ncbi:MAG: hypothetical protein ACI4VL_00720 [Bacilli bacterium]
MELNEIIKWCNDNSGFAQIILSLITILISLLAIVISIITARLPYKKKILLTCGSYIEIGYDDDGIHVTVTNIGNRNVYIKNIGIILDKKMILQSKESFPLKDKILAPGESVSTYLSSTDLKKYKAPTKKAYAFFEDNENSKKYKYICKTNIF